MKYIIGFVLVVSLAAVGIVKTAEWPKYPHFNPATTKVMK